jgi:hypothetical protein
MGVEVRKQMSTNDLRVKYPIRNVSAADVNEDHSC